MTKVERFNQLLTLDEVQADSGLVDFINHEIELASKKRSGSKKPTENQTENAKFIEDIIKTLAESPNGLTISDIIANTPSLADYRDKDGNSISNQRVNAILRKETRPTADEPDKGNPDGRIKKFYVKRKATFTLAD